MKALAAAVAVVASLAAAQAYAAGPTYEFKGTDSQGAFDAKFTFDVSGGYATGGSGTITGAGFGSQTLQLVTKNTPDAIQDGDGFFGLQSNGGDNLDGYDDAIPVDKEGGVLFAVGTAAPAKGSSLLIGFFLNSGSDYSYQFYGTSTATGFRFGESSNGGTTGTMTSAAVSAAPEPGAWALMLGGVGAMGLMLRRRRSAALTA